MVDYSPLHRGDMLMSDFARGFGVDALAAAVHALYDETAQLLHGATDAQVAFIPDDPDAYDPFAVPGEERIGWSLGHLVAHVTASSEEYATFSSLLARGIPCAKEPRLRRETPWREIATRDAALRRLEESRRMVLSYLAAWPADPDLTTVRALSERFVARFGPQNAPAALLMGLMHHDGHMPQMRAVLSQAQAAAEAAPGD